MSDKTFRIELEFKGLTRRSAMTAMIGHFPKVGVSSLLSGAEEYRVSDHEDRDWYLLGGKHASRLCSPRLDYDADRVQTHSLMGILAGKGAQMDDTCQMRISTEAMSEAESEAIAYDILKSLRKGN